MTQYTVSERVKRVNPDGPEWRPVSAYVVVDARGIEVGEVGGESRADAEALAGLLNEAYEAGREGERERRERIKEWAQS